MAQFSLVGGFQPIRKHISQLGSIILSLKVVGGWPTPLKNDGVKVSWDDEIPNWMEK